MIRFLLNNCPTWAVVIGMMLFCTLIAWGIYYCINQVLKKMLLAHDLHYARESIHLTSVLCAFLLAFMIVSLWQSYEVIEESVLEEAKAIGRIEIFSESLPKENDAEISKLLEIYVNMLINDEWPKMKKGHESLEVEALSIDLRHAIENIPDTNPSLSQFRHQMLQDFNDLVFARELRLDHLDTSIPHFFMFTILVNLIGMFALLCLLKPVENKKSHHFFLLMTSLLLGLNLSFLLVLDYPFSGELSVSSRPLAQIHFD